MPEVPRRIMGFCTECGAPGTIFFAANEVLHKRPLPVPVGATLPALHMEMALALRLQAQLLSQACRNDVLTALAKVYFRAPYVVEVCAERLHFQHLLQRRPKRRQHWIQKENDGNLKESTRLEKAPGKERVASQVSRTRQEIAAFLRRALIELAKGKVEAMTVGKAGKSSTQRRARNSCANLQILPVCHSTRLGG